MNNNNINNSFENIDENQQENQINLEEYDKQFTLYFTTLDKEIYLNTEPTTPFSKILFKLKEKYEWLEQMNVKGFKYNNSLINLKTTPNQNGIGNNSKIQIIV